MSQHKNKISICINERAKHCLDFITAKGDELKSKLFPFLLGYIIFICVTILVTWGLVKIWYSLMDLNIFRVSPSTFSFQTPPWITDRFSHDIKNLGGLRKHYSLYEHGLTQKIAEVYEGMASVKKVNSIKRIFPNKLAIRLVLRKPAVIIKSGNTTYLVDDEYVLLPKHYYKLPVEYESPYIRIDKLSNLPPYGGIWDDKRVKTGVELVKFLDLNNILNLFKILVVDVSNVCRRDNTSRSEIVLWTENNTQIRWGCSSFCEVPDELSDEEKLQNLLSIAKSEGTNLKQMEYVDVRWKKPLGKRWVTVHGVKE
jgi:cell division septal protein FtsQ